MSIAQAEVYEIPVLTVEEEHTVTETERQQFMPNIPGTPLYQTSSFDTGDDPIIQNHINVINSTHDTVNTSRHMKILDSLKDIPRIFLNILKTN